MFNNTPYFVRVILTVLVLVLGACEVNDAIAPELDLMDASVPDIQRADDVPSTECYVDADCDADAGPCARSECYLGRCRVADLPDYLPCDDNNPCTQSTVCESGVCGGGTVAVCDDDNPCTDDTCSPVTGCKHVPGSEDTLCDDGDPCTVGDRCAAGGCQGNLDERCACTENASCQWLMESNRCAGDYECVDGLCAHVAGSEVVCPSAGPCVVGQCIPATGECSWLSEVDGTACDDMNPCTEDGVCDRGACVGTGELCECKADADCVAFQTADYNLCLGPLTCSKGLCVPDASKAVGCPTEDESGLCTLTLCDPSTGLCGQVALVDGTACVSATPCSPAGICTAGACAPESPVCDDGNPCTDDLCTDELACEHLPGVGACDDGDACTELDECAEGACQGVPLVCDDGNACTAESCDPMTGECLTAEMMDGAPCGGACLSGASCLAGVCEGGTEIDCEDGNPCTTHSCMEGTGCLQGSVADGTVCEDGDPCTQEGACTDGNCEAWPTVCSDGDPCTVDACNAEKGGCWFETAADGTECQGDNPCLTNGQCEAGTCVGGAALVCAPGSCASMACDEASGECVTVAVVPDGQACLDAGPCMAGGSCESGSCKGASPVNCDDEDPCTVDSCSPLSGVCSHVPKSCEQPNDACEMSSCQAEAGGCSTQELPICSKGKVLWKTTFPCEAEPEAGWTFEILSGSVGFAVDSLPENPGAWDDGCSLNFNNKNGYNSGPNTPSSASATSAPLVLGMSETDDVELHIGYWEWVDVDENEGTDLRHIGLLSDKGAILKEQLLPKEPSQANTWVYRQVVFVLGAQDTSVRLRFRFDSVNGTENEGVGWFIDRLVVSVVSLN